MNLADAFERARLLLDADRFDEAIALLLEAARGHEDDQLEIELAWAYTERGRSRDGREALEDFAEAVTWTELPETLAARAEVHLKQGNLEAAEASVARALELDAETPEALLAKARLRVAQKQLPEAIEVLRKVTEGWNSPAGLMILADVFASLGRRDDAHGALTEGLKHDPFSADLHQALAASHAGAGRSEAARQAWKRALELEGNDARPWRGLAELAAREGDELEMHHALDRALELDPQGTRAWLEKESSNVPQLKSYLQ